MSYKSESIEPYLHINIYNKTSYIAGNTLDQM